MTDSKSGYSNNFQMHPGISGSVEVIKRTTLADYDVELRFGQELPWAKALGILPESESSKL